MRQAVFDTPAAPPGWEGSGVDLIRIVDPLGGAIAWLAPDLGANCVGFAVRTSRGRDVGWTHILRSGGPRALLARPDCYGCAVLSTPPRRRPDANASRWLRDAPALRRWRFIERDPTAAVLETTVPFVAGDDSRGDQPSGLRLRLTALLDDAALSLVLVAHNEGAGAIFVGLGLHPSFAVGLLGLKTAAKGGQTSDRAKRGGVPRRAMPMARAHTSNSCPAPPKDTIEWESGAGRGVRIKLARSTGIGGFVLYAPTHHPMALPAPWAYTPFGRLLRLPAGAWHRLVARISVVDQSYESAVR